MAATYSPQEKQYYDQLFAIVDKDNTGILPGQDAYPFLTSSNLPTTSLGEVWALADPENNGFLTKEGWYRAARIIGWLQKGGATSADDSLANKAGPLPSFDKGPPPPAIQPQLTGQRTQPPPLSAHNTGAGSAGLPALTPADRAKFTRLFAGAGPSNGLVSGDKARDMFLKSGLSYDQLGQIWNLADTQERGSLDLTDFVIGMFLIQSCMTNPSLNLPAVLPNGVYETASGGRAPPPKAPASPISRQHTGGAVPSPIRPQYTGGMGAGGILQPQRTGQSATGVPGVSTPPRASNTQKSFASPPTSSTFSTIPSTSSFGAPQRQMSGFTNQQSQTWDVTAQAKATSDSFFSQLDTQNRGVIEGDVAVPFMLQSQLDENTLASIWDLADIRKEGKLTRDEFAVAMHLINGKLAGQDVPSSLPNSLVPPSLRETYGNGNQEVLSSQGASSATKDLFDVFGDDEPAPTPKATSPQIQQRAQAQPFSASAFLPQPPAPPSRRSTAQASAPRALSPAPTGNQAAPGFGMAPFAPASRGGDLLGDDSAEDKPSAVPDNSAEFGNKQNQLANTTRGINELEKSHAELDETAKTSAAQLEELEAKLSSARSRHETETKAVADLRIKVGEQKERHKKLESEVISAESDLSAMRSEKDELEQALLRDKEEVRGLQKMMKEIEEEKTGMKLVLEKLRKEARQQKGMLTIAKKQLSTAEGGRDGVQKEIRDTEQEIEDDKAELEKASLPQPQQHASPPPQSAAFFSPSVAAGVPLPATPKALSPAPTGASTRSNNPFERLAGARSASVPPQPPSQAASPPPPQQEESTSPSFGTAALAGVTAAVGAAAGVAVAGAETLYDAAKDAVTGGSPEAKTDSHDKELDPFGAPSSFDEQDATLDEQKTPVPTGTGEESDPFGLPSASKDSTDPFGAPTTPKAAEASGFDNFDSGFGDSFTAASASEGQKPTEDLHLAPASEHAGEPVAAPKDFDSAFADFDQQPENDNLNELGLSNNQGGLEEGIPSGIPKSAILAELTARPEAERTFSTQAIAGESIPPTPSTEIPSSGFGSSPASVKAPLPSSGLAQEVRSVDDGESSDEEEGPEDLEGPSRGYGTTQSRENTFDDFENGSSIHSTTQPEETTAAAPTAALAPPILAVEEPTPTKVRRHAPPPPANKSTPPPNIPTQSTSTSGFGGDDEFDPFGAPVTSTSNAAPAAISSQSGNAPKTASFDEDDFDFSDLPPAQVDQNNTTTSAPTTQSGNNQNSSSAFDDDFANFDDEFENVNVKNNDNNNGGSENSNETSKSYEIVSPQQTQHQRFDEWGYHPSSQPSTTQQGHSQTQTQSQEQGQGQQQQGLSFDDAFGGDFEPSGPRSGPRSVQHEEAFAPPPGPPLAQAQASSQAQQETQLQPPPMPQRRPSGAQPDDIEDVKKLCAMGFSRGLVVEALAANGYDFQKALNVLL